MVPDLSGGRLGDEHQVTSPEVADMVAHEAGAGTLADTGQLQFFMVMPLVVKVRIDILPEAE